VGFYRRTMKEQPAGAAAPTAANQGVDAAISALARGEMVVVLDDEDRENEGDLIIAAEKATAESIGFMVRHSSGVICAAMTPQRLDELKLPLMVHENTESQRTAFTVSVDKRPGTGTGISAADRATTLRALADPSSEPADFARPGHVFPLRAREGGVLHRPGHTEAAVDLARMAGFGPVGVLCEVVNDDGSMPRRDELVALARNHGLALTTVADLIRHRMRNESFVERTAEGRIPTPFGQFEAFSYRSALDDVDHLALVFGEVDPKRPVLTRVHSECLTGDVFGSRRCDCGEQLAAAMRQIAAEGTGVVVYLRGHEGRGIGLAHKLHAYKLQDHGRDTVEANVDLGLPVDSRDYGIGSQILAALGATRLRLMTNNPAKFGGLAGYGLEIVERVPLEIQPNDENVAYLRTKREKLGHLLDSRSQ
jgi:3,4-dihydroxy 2-butanone 4-phosphate synthase / GTP cyclohydrolase II